MENKNLQDLLKWSIELQSQSANATKTPETQQDMPKSQLNPEILDALLGGPSEADLMKAAIEVATSTDPEITVEDKTVALDNFEQLVESLDNANNIAKLALWEPLLACLKHSEPDLRRMAAWCVGTAVQNNTTCQEHFLQTSGLDLLVEVATDSEETPTVRKKAIFALSSLCRNNQTALNQAIKQLSEKGIEHGEVDATNMDAVDTVIASVRQSTDVTS